MVQKLTSRLLHFFILGQKTYVWLLLPDYYTQKAIQSFLEVGNVLVVSDSKTTGFGIWEKVIELFQEIKGKHIVYV